MEIENFWPVSSHGHCLFFGVRGWNHSQSKVAKFQCKSAGHGHCLFQWEKGLFRITVICFLMDEKKYKINLEIKCKKYEPASNFKQ